MKLTHSTAAAGPRTSLLGRWAAELTVRRVAVVMVLSVLAAALLNPIFIPPFPVVLGRTLVVGTVLLLAFTAASLWAESWLPRWLVQVLAVALAAPAATFLVYLFAVGGDVAELVRHEGRLSGFVSISMTAIVIGIVVALGALYRERDAQARAAALQFELEKSTLERQALDAKLTRLHAQIEPHFLFNTLANVQALVESGSERAAPVLRHLIAYLRAAMPRLDDAEATLAAEVDLVRAYLELMHLRMPDRMSFDVTLAPELRSLRFPTMALLTVVENAVRHGIDPSEEGGRIEVGGRRDGETVTLWVADTGVGMSETAAPGTGLANLHARLQAFYGPGARLDLHEVAPHGLRAEIVLPGAGAHCAP
ncbi:MAG TPA: histidine kinase [Burkholderiaceae bacterium]|nr:histidine kinase [Burkholderiaceae bacterium]